MTNNDCNIIKDLQPLYTDNLISDETKSFIEEHLNQCGSCKKLYQECTQDLKLELDIEKSIKKDDGSILIKKIKKSQDRIKFFTIILSMFASVLLNVVNSGFIFTIPFIIIVPFILTLIYKDTISILIAGTVASLLIGTLAISFSFSLFFSTPIVVLCSFAANLFAKTILKFFKKEN